MRKPTKKDKEEAKIWGLCRPGIEKWVEMMVKEGELKICDDKYTRDKHGKIIQEETIYGWTGEDEIVSSIISFIVQDKLG